MANWNGLILTELGKELNAKINAGLTTLQFNRVALGSGTPASSNATSLAKEEQSFVFDVNPPKVKGRVMTLEFTAHNKDLLKQYTISELGLFARDPERGIILFAYMTDSAPDVMPARGTATVVNRKMNINITTDNTGSVSVITEGKFLTIEDLDTHNSTEDVHSAAFAAHNNDKNSHKVITDAIKALKGTSAFDTSVSKSVTEIITLLGMGGIVAAKLDANAGFVKFANGFIIQWGRFVATNNPLPWRVVFPVTFKEICTGVFTSRLDGGYAFSHIINELGKEYFTYVDRNHVNESGKGDTICWLAIGK